MFDIRAARADDVAQILDFIRQLADFERAPEQVLATEELLAESLFGPQAVSRALVCERHERPIGFAVYFYNYSTWLGRKGLYLEDLFIEPSSRRAGAGTALLRHLARLAVAEGCGRFEWSVLDWNEAAIRFYEALGAQAQAEWITYRLSGAALRRLADAS